MPYKEKPIERKYFPIGYVAEEMGVAPSLIRFWEKQFPEVKPKKNKNGKRLYTKKEIEKLKSIFVLVKEKGYTLSGAKNILEQKDPGVQDNKQYLLDSMTELRAFLIDLRDKL